MQPTAQETLTAEDKIWFAQPVDVEVEPDNRGWLDSMMEMKQLELINYGVYQYNIPRTAAEALTRSELMQMIVTYSFLPVDKKGVGQKVRYTYIRALKHVLSPMVAIRGERPLYLVRGRGDAMQVYNKETKDWTNIAVLLDKASAMNSQIEQAITPDGHTAPQLNQVLPESKIVEKVVTQTQFVINPTRPELEQIAAEMGIQDASNVEKYPSKQSIMDAINSFEQSELTDSTEG